MGGERSEVRAGTTRVLMEAATWNGPNLQRTSTALGLRTEASGRFEKQLQPEQGMDGQGLAAKLMIELCGARLVDGTVDVGGPGPAPRVIRLRDERLARLLGAAIPRDVAAELLRRLEFGVADVDDGLDVSVPAFRRDDVYREADLVEEVARLWGLEKLPTTLPSRRGATGRLEPAQRMRRRAEAALAGAGLYEAVGWSFAAPELVERLRIPPDDPRHAVVALRNSLSRDQSVLRTTLLGSLLDVARRNHAHGMPDVRLFEAGTVFLDRPRAGEKTAVERRSGPLPEERRHLAALLTGPLRPPTWREPEPPRADFFAVKGVLATLMEAIRVPWRVERAREPFLHPGRAARVLVGDGEPAGWLGELHPAVAREWDLEGGAGFELDLAALERAAVAVPHFEDYTTFPAVHRDLAIVLPEAVPAADVEEAIARVAGATLKGAKIFDVYHGPQAGEGRRSLALHLQFGAPDRTLTDEEATATIERILEALAEQYGATRRG
jgi:phenylalanyl-tRNA synthetase beta chain